MHPYYGQIGLVYGPETVYQQVISKVTGSEIYHVIIGVSATECVSPGPDGVTIEPITDYTGILWSSYPHTPEQADSVVEYALSMVGRPYNWLNNVSIALEFVTKRYFGPKLQKIIENPRKYHCAQLAYDSLVLGGQIPVFGGSRPPGGVFPALFTVEFARNGWDHQPKPAILALIEEELDTNGVSWV